ncbi:MAG: hypothetical protein JW739_00775 [Opitutales bacterium]|nr:hypothetical protein [Opitutales bacterium]
MNKLLTNIVVVVVVYKIRVTNVKTYDLLESLSASGLSVLFYDNSPDSFEGNLPEGFLYVHNPRNPGISDAYNYGYDLCLSMDKKWLLLLDQDTNLDESFFDNLDTEVSFIGGNASYAAILPFVYSVESRLISPCYVGRMGRAKVVNSRVFDSRKRVLSVNSGLLVSVDFLRDINGFSPDYRLDMLDYWFFSMIYKKGKKVLFSKSNIVHELSVLSDDYMSISRYDGLLIAEKRYFKSEGLLILYYFRLVFRCLKHIQKKRYRFAFVTFSFILKA